MHLTGGISAFELRQNMSLSNTSVPAESHLIKVNKILSSFQPVHVPGMHYDYALSDL